MKNQVSWKTNAAGIGAIATAIGTICAAISKDTIDVGVLVGGISALIAGIGLLNARDNDKTSEEVGASAKAVTRAYEDQ